MRKILILIICWFSFTAGASRNFNGSTSIVQTTFNQTPAAISIGFWEDTNDGGENNAGRVVDDSGNFEVFSNNSITGYFFSYKWTVAQGQWNISSGYDFSDGVWDYMMVTYDSGDVVNDAQWYANGSTTSTNENVTPDGSPTSDQGNQLDIGNRRSDTARTFNGELSYLSIHSRVLTVVEINELMWKPGTVADNLVGFWTLFGDSTEVDLSPTGADGTPSNSNASSSGPPVFFGGIPL